MTARWGPLGWITLHSISANYPEDPSQADKLILKKYVGLFADTISCPSCKSHFLTMFNTYTSRNPNWWDSRANLFTFICRAHNTVNRRLDKPIIQSIRDSIDTLLELTKITNASEYRRQYLVYLQRNWSSPDAEGFMMGHAVREMAKINAEYWNPRETNFAITVPESDVLQPIVPVRGPTGSLLPGMRSDGSPAQVGFSLRSGRFSLVRR
jgi:FAD-linked sulfhydryl oxidase